MSIRIGWRELLAVVPPLVAIVVGLSIHDRHWEPSGIKRGIPAVGLILASVACCAGIVLTYVPFVREYLSRDFWYRLHYVKSNPTQASIFMVVLRFGCVATLWLIAAACIANS